MEMKKMIRVGILIFAVFALFVVGMGTATAAIVICDLYIGEHDGGDYFEWDNTRRGWVVFQNTCLKYNSTESLIVKIDGETVLETKVRADKVTIEGFVYYPVGYQYFKLNETKGAHVVEAIIKSNTYDVTKVFEYNGTGTEEEVVEEKPEEEVVEEVETVEEPEEEVEERTYNVSAYPPFESEEMKIVMITEEKSYHTGRLSLRIIIESNGKEYTFGVRKSDYWDDKIREEIQEAWSKSIREIEEEAERDWSLSP